MSRFAHLTTRGEQDGWARAAHIATVLACGIAVVALLVGYVQYRENLSVQRSLAAASIYRDQLKLSIDSSASANGEVNLSDSTVLKSHRWFVAHAFHSAEAILSSAGDDPGWRATIESMVEFQRTYVCHPDFPVHHYGEPFIGLALRKIRESDPECCLRLADRLDDWREGERGYRSATARRHCYFHERH